MTSTTQKAQPTNYDLDVLLEDYSQQLVPIDSLPNSFYHQYDSYDQGVYNIRIPSRTGFVINNFC